jgi:predicted metal-dependent HD superfamily phosphohydrolase
MIAPMAASGADSHDRSASGDGSEPFRGAGGGDLLCELTRRYCEPHRRYHSLRHIAEMLWAGRDLDLDDVQIAAIWFHDAIYEIPGPDNEERSALLAEVRLPTLGWSAEDVAAVARIVRDTATHDPSDDRSALVIDLDLMSLAAEPDVFDRNTADIRAEYATVPDDVFEENQLRVLESFLQKERIYRTDWGAGLEDDARRNLERVVKRLRGA